MQKSCDAAALLKRIPALDQEIAEDQRQLWEIEKRRTARLLREEQFAFYLKHAVEGSSPDLAGK